MAMAESVAPEAVPSSDYLELLQLVERLHRQLLDVVKDELDREGLDDLNSVQALLLFNIGDQELTAGELRTRGHYLGSNVSYNLKKLVDAGYIRHERSAVDRRSVRVSLTESGHAVCAHLNKLFDRQGSSLNPVGGVDVDQLPGINTALARIERFWADHIRFRM
ncbi:transcriptional regulator LdtR [Maricaulis maris]|jgi:DNA-binding MarR family transcriptional regulator|uniref:transcriptional regulator LdtR n=1 Tax=Maricaulis maris TaxID=74318 RepID=UPI00291E9869|nr:MarR family transcriptional regulator [Maricaulis maris]